MGRLAQSPERLNSPRLETSSPPSLRVEEKILKTYKRNDFKVAAYLVGYEAGRHEVKLDGQDTMEVLIRLVKKPE